MDDPGETWVHVVPSEWSWQRQVSNVIFSLSRLCVSLLFQVSKQLKVYLQMHLEAALANPWKPCLWNPRVSWNTAGHWSGSSQRFRWAIPFHGSVGGRALCSEKLSTSSLMLPYLHFYILCLFHVGYIIKPLAITVINEWQYAVIPTMLPCLLEKQTQ